jgi:tetratricopeptide (TPR) repeat protein
MPRFSAEAKEVFDTIWYHSDLDQAQKLISNLKNPSDIVFGNIWVIFYLGNLQRLEKYLEILIKQNKLNRDLQDPFLQFFINSLYCMYYCGFLNPVIDREEAQRYLELNEQEYPKLEYEDQWEEDFTKGWYYFTKAFYTFSVQGDIPTAIELQKKGGAAVSKLNQDKEIVSAIHLIQLGWYTWLNGNFDEAESHFNQSLENLKLYDNYWKIIPYLNFALMNLHQGNQQKATEWNEYALEIAIRFDNIRAQFECYSIKGNILMVKGNYREALKSYKESLKYRKLHNQPLQIFFGYYEIFTFYYYRYKLTQDKLLLEEAEKIRIELENFSNNHSDNTIIVNFTKYCLALILKQGNLKKKGQATLMLEELLEIYPHNLEMSYELLELLFEDVLISDEPETINQIDNVIENIGKMGLRNNPQALIGFVSQQIFLAKYKYYIKGDPSSALNILNNAKKSILPYKLDLLIDRLDTALMELERQYSKWDNLDLSLKDRIKTSEFKKYIQEALKIAGKQI